MGGWLFKWPEPHTLERLNMSSVKDRERAIKWYHDNLERAKSNRKRYYWLNPDKWREEALKYRKSFKGKESDARYKDKTRHAGKRKELIDEHGYVCFNCGCGGTPHSIVAHHSTFEADRHEHQELLCRSCHCIIHHWS